MNLRKLLLRCSIAFLFLLFPKHSFAADNFSTDYTVTYQVQDDATTHGRFSVTLTNLTSQYYASSYKIEVGFPHITHLVASDGTGSIKPVLSDSPNGHEIGVTFNEHVVGKGNKLVFTIQFDTPDIAEKHGAIWEINIPGIADQNDFSSFNVQVKTPVDFGQPTFIKPPQPTNTMIFSKDMLGKSGISIAYGDRQTYNFHLTYHLQNTNLFPIQTEIALPPTTNYQDVGIQSIVPPPQNVTIDRDGNWLAQYVLSPSQKMDVLASGHATLFLYPKSESLSKDDVLLYTKSQPYWNDTSGSIKKLALELKTPKAIFDYVVKTLSYDYSRVTSDAPRFGAANVLKNPSSAVCLEFTDLFIAIARAAGIPAREMNGYAYTQNTKERPLSLVEDILHAWPEYYDTVSKTWIMVDPTWSNTTGGVDYFDTLDFDHFAFVVKGVSSTYPVPAGGYKYAGDEKKKDVLVTFGDTPVSREQKLSINPVLADPYLAGIPINGQVVVKNIGESLSNQQEITLLSQDLTPGSQKITLSKLPPFGSTQIPFSFAKTSLLTNSTHTFTMNLAGSQIEKKFTIKTLFTIYPLFTGGIILVILSSILLIVALKSRRVPLS